MRASSSASSSSTTTTSSSMAATITVAAVAGSGSPCAACKFLRRKCQPECIFAPYFPPDQPQKFVHVHKVFGASNVTKLLNDLNPLQREDAVNSLAYEAETRLRDPVYGCVGVISLLNHQLRQLQVELTLARAELTRYQAAATLNMVNSSPHSILGGRQDQFLAPLRGATTGYGNGNYDIDVGVRMGAGIAGYDTGITFLGANGTADGVRAMAGPPWAGGGDDPKAVGPS